MNEFEPTNVIYWNTLYRADAGEQLAHIEHLTNEAREANFGRVILCLSEVSSTLENDGLRNILEQNDYSVAYAPVSKVGKRIYEGLAIASKDIKGLTEKSSFDVLKMARGIRNTKARMFGAVELDDGLKIAVSHLSYPFPSIEETLQTLQKDFHIYGGDFNTVVSKKYIREMEASGRVKVSDPHFKSTFPIGFKNVGLELDHVLFDDKLSQQVQVKLDQKGPSNHRPLLVSLL